MKGGVTTASSFAVDPATVVAPKSLGVQTVSNATPANFGGLSRCY